MIEKLGTTGCLALALLNDEGIPAGCEGDLQSIFTLLIAKTLTGQAGFMANPAFINDDLNENSDGSLYDCHQNGGSVYHPESF